MGFERPVFGLGDRPFLWASECPGFLVQRGDADRARELALDGDLDVFAGQEVEEVVGKFQPFGFEPDALGGGLSRGRRPARKADLSQVGFLFPQDGWLGLV